MKTLEEKYENSSSISLIYPSFYLVAKDYDLKNKKCIDLGASNGRYLKLMGEKSCGIEYSNIDVEYCKKKGLNVIKGNLNKNFDFYKGQDFDFIFSSHVIEHLESPYLFLKRIHEFGGKNAKLILGYPIENSIVRCFDPYFNHDGHLYAFSYANIKKLGLISKNGWLK